MTIVKKDKKWIAENKGHKFYGATYSRALAKCSIWFLRR